VTAQSIEGWLVDSEAGLTVALDTTLTPELVHEGLAREFVNRVQNMRKDAGFDVTDRIRILFQAPPRITEAVEKLSTYVMSETLATQISQGTNGNATRMDIDGENCDITITRV
jgi:isoleucyl-tRNA synthetase